MAPTKKTYYVIRLGRAEYGVNNYVRNGSGDAGGFQTDATLATALRFNSVGEVLTRFADRDRQYAYISRNLFQIVRVEETVTPGTPKRTANFHANLLVPPQGMKIAVMSKLGGGFWRGMHGTVPVYGELADARLFDNVMDAVHALQDASAYSAQSVIPAKKLQFVAVTEEPAQPTTTYTETVLA